jgi:hypothetical protein
MIEAVENHNPEAIVIDEIGRELEAAAARTIAERGVQLIGTAHGNTLENLLLNPTLADLVGGIESVTLSDEEARRRGTQKTVLERRSPPTFDVLIEIQTRDCVAVHPDVASAVDALLRGYPLPPELRSRINGDIRIERAPALKHTVTHLTLPIHRASLAEYQAAGAEVRRLTLNYPDEPAASKELFARFVADTHAGEKRRQHGPFDNKELDFVLLENAQAVVKRYETQDRTPTYSMELHAIRLGDCATARTRASGR